MYDEITRLAIVFIVGLIAGLTVLTAVPGTGEVSRAIEHGCGKYNIQTGDFEYLNNTEDK